MDCKTAREMNFDSLTARILLTCRQSVFVVCWLVCDWIMTACSLVSLCSASSLRSAEMTGDTDARRERSSRTSNSEAADSTDVDIPPGQTSQHDDNITLALTGRFRGAPGGPSLKNHFILPPTFGLLGLCDDDSDDDEDNVNLENLLQ